MTDRSKPEPLPCGFIRALAKRGEKCSNGTLGCAVVHPYCPDAPDHLHWSVAQLWALQAEKTKDLGQYVRRAAYELEKAAKAIESLSPRLQRKVLREQRELDPLLLRNEAERARDILHVMGLLDV